MKRVEVKEGERYGRLTIIREVEPAGSVHKRVRRFLCRCDCGNEIICRLPNLKSGTTKSCGCYRKFVSSNRRDCHHLQNTRIYRIWCGMKRRCYNKHNEHFDRYGGRGIIVCDEWKTDFMNFYDWAMSNGYDDKLSIDRINNEGNYEPSNCRWANQKQQIVNSTATIKCSLGGNIVSLSDIADILGVSFKRIRRIVYMLNNGYDMSELLSLSKKDDSFMFAEETDADKKAIVDLKPKCEFKPFDRVITRVHGKAIWTANIFSHVDQHGKYVTIGCISGYTYCLPYNEETAHLIGTTDEWKGGEG